MDVDLIYWLRWNAKEQGSRFGEAADEIERLRSVLMMWVKFFDEDGEEDIFAAEEAMEATRQVLNMGDEDGV